MARAFYIVTYGFVSDGGDYAGKTEPKRMAREDLLFSLLMVDPFNYDRWSGQGSALRRRGDHMVLTIRSESDGHGTVGRFLKIQKA